MLHLFGKTTLKADFWLHPKQLLVTLGSLIALTPLGSDTSSRKRAPELFRLLRFENIVELPSLFKNKTIWILTHGSGFMDFIINLPYLRVRILSWLERIVSIIISHLFFH